LRPCYFELPLGLHVLVHSLPARLGHPLEK
jgi:hypothetical protein